ncbi:hypothetical protein BN7_5505 [Wickerhamomyces ciferrii]|uniref:PH domain-containing protein n=1 Tax=Wickerhamomyces ciferrii (strain ATCC 14091 / BCRC 22168 / CBS 111 / JCM 3599 / NBRC 0793 / NRRL Y-1031 F-60-10) TaxID=1206466 RepID=K0KXW3_WICCF|nr:uncharacterized protein BN7_5505 [Wickerhamomyces ciferrii]CCH45918.1 hypothetical protein BN7_5505 [Wickerhamomyces ciferrii]
MDIHYNNINLKPKIKKITSSSSSSNSSQTPLSNNSSSTSLSLLSSRSSRSTLDPVTSSSPHSQYLKYQTSPLCTMSSTEYQKKHQKSSNSSQTSLKSNKQHQQQQQQQESMDYLEYMEKQPCYPPTYSAANASKSIRFPIYEQEETHILPDYSPSIYQISLGLKKIEWLSPYEPSPIRNWKNVIMELNSTQLNFYSIDHQNIPLLNRVKKSKTKKIYEFTPIESEFILNTIKQNPMEYLTSKKLIKSYSLQFAKFGLPVDYKKKNNCLRIRAETEQFLIHFHTIDEMINWSNYLSTGINVSLDLESRKLPNDRTVPRRRRNRRGSSSNRNRSYSDSELIRRELSTSSANKRRSSFSGGPESSIKGKISRLFNRKRSDVSLNDIEELALKFQQQTTVDDTPSSRPSSTPLSNQLEDELVEEAEAEEAESIRNEISTIQEEEEENDEQEPNSIHELHDDSDDDDELEEPSNNDLFNNFHLNFGSSSSSSDDDDTKQWLPEHKLITRRKYLKDSIRCIKLLPGDEEWVGKFIVRSSNPPRYKTINQLNSKNSKNKFVKEFIVGPQGLVSVVN